MDERPPIDDLASRRNLADAAGVLQSPERWETMVATENEWAARMPDTEELRTLLGLIAGMIIRRGAHPRLLADYMRQVIRETFPSGFDSPVP